MNDKLVSVIIPTYGRPNFLGKAVNSVLKQTHPNIEIIIIDDNHSNSLARIETEQLMAKFLKNDNIIYVKHKKNKRVAAARNTGVHLAKGDYISFLDDDDEFYENKIKEQIKFLEINQLYNGCYCKFKSFSNNKLTRESSYTSQGDLSLDVYKFRCTGNASCYMFKKDVFLQSGDFNEELPRHEDFEFLVRFFEKNLMGFVDNYGVKRNTDSRINMPSIQQYIDIKRKFFKSVEKNLNNLPKLEVKKIQKIHDADLFFFCLRKKDFLKAITFFPGFLAMISYLYVKLPNIQELLKRNLILK